MDLEHWYRCTRCGHRYTPLQIHALIQLIASRSPAPGGAAAEPSLRSEPPETGKDSGPAESIPCRKRGCTGTLAPTGEKYQEPR